MSIGKMCPANPTCSLRSASGHGTSPSTAATRLSPASGLWSVASGSALITVLAALSESALIAALLVASESALAMALPREGAGDDKAKPSRAELLEIWRMKGVRCAWGAAPRCGCWRAAAVRAAAAGAEAADVG